MLRAESDLMMRGKISGAIALTCALLGCGSGAPGTPVEHARPVESAEPGAPDSASNSSPAPPSASADADPPRTSNDPQPPVEEAPAPRQIDYVVTPEGLEVRVEDVRFLANAQAQRMGGGWGVELALTATVKGDEPRSLLVPSAGPLALAGVIERGGSSEKFKDERSGEGEQLLEPGKPYRFTRRWPGKGEKPLAKGDSVELDVALWGVGKDAETRRPVRQMFRVKLTVGAGKPSALLTPPPSAGT